MTAEVIIYSKANCPYCDRAKQLLSAKNVTWHEIRIDLNPEFQQEMITLSGGRRTVPQIFINGQPIGGFDDMAALEKAGKLNALLAM
ncbi:MAG TPA: glutaredoxin 3 [Gammaproteobacteria bacterium]|nr:glutaredoxin 3 [Gammaproteobacteria bacterium]